MGSWDRAETSPASRLHPPVVVQSGLYLQSGLYCNPLPASLILNFATLGGFNHCTAVLLILSLLQGILVVAVGCCAIHGAQYCLDSQESKPS